MLNIKILFILTTVSVIVCRTDSTIFIGEDIESGIMDLGNGDDMFYWLFRSRNAPSTDPLLIRLSGGPGCASEFAIFYENGPFTINDDLSLKNNPYSWNNNANVLYVDQPFGTGFSETTDPEHYALNYDDMIAEPFFRFLIEFYSKYPEFNQRSLFISGGSYVGHYISAIAKFIVRNSFKNDWFPINLKGIAIGNGWMDPHEQYPAYADFSYENGLIGTAKYYSLKAAFKVCQFLINQAPWQVSNYACQQTAGTVLNSTTNIYDIRRKCDHPPFCYDFSLLDEFIARPDIRDEIGVGNRTWSSCNMHVNASILGDWVTNVKPNVNDLLDAGIKVLVYSGDKDLLFNWRGGEAWTNSQPWSKQDQFNKKEYDTWSISGKAVGEYKNVDNFTFLKIYDAGHLVSMDQSEVCLEMINQFMGIVH
jgi:cathepsin A (carboxypeptidase C)